MTGPLLNSDRLFQTLLATGLEYDVAGELDADTIETMPAMVHSSSFQQNGNSDGLWQGILTVHLFAYAASAFTAAAELYELIHSWGDHPLEGVVPGVGAVVTVEDMNSLSRSSGEVSMDNKQVVQFSGSFEITIKHL